MSTYRSSSGTADQNELSKCRRLETDFVSLVEFTSVPEGINTLPSNAFTVFNARKEDIDDIAVVFDEMNSGRGRNTHYSLLNGALVLLVSSWEVYCEDVCRQAGVRINERENLTFANLNERLRRDLIKYAGSKYRENQDPLEAKIALLPDSGWRQILTDRLDEYIGDFNTPRFSRQRGKNLNELFEQVLGIRRMSGAIEDFLEDQGLCQRLDDVVSLRGEIAHTGEAPEGRRLTANTLRDHTSSFVEAAAAVDVIFHRQFQDEFGFAPWQITQPIRDALRPAARAKLRPLD